jgi:maleylacetoacetate isomerase
MKLYTYYRSSAAYRVRIALHLKGIQAEQAFVHLRRQEQQATAYLQVNPAALVPSLEHDGHRFVQSLAIIEYLEELFPQPALLPAAAADRAFVRSIALAIACDIHPLNNLRVLNYLKVDLSVDTESRDRWYAHWIQSGLSALESVLAQDPRVGRHCCGDFPSLADVCLVPQMYNAERMKCHVEKFPTLRRLVESARALPAFQAAAPEAQPDTE